MEKKRMSKCGICGNEILTGDIHRAIGICNNCYNKLYKSDEQKYVDMLHKENNELTSNSPFEEIKERLKKATFEIKKIGELIDSQLKLELIKRDIKIRKKVLRKLRRKNK